MAVQKRIRSGKTRWIGRYRAPSGKEFSKTFDTRREAQAWVISQESAIRKDEWVDPRGSQTTVAQVCQSYVDAATRPGTRDSREALLKNLGPLADMTLGQLTPSDIEAWYGTLTTSRPWAREGRPLAPSTAFMAVGYLGAALQRAVRDGLITKNPQRGAEIPSSASPRRAVDSRYIPDAVMINRFVTDLENAGQTQLAFIVRILAATGMRAGELAGLTVDSLDAPGLAIHIAHQALKDRSLAPLKTESSRRVIAVDSELMGELVDWAATYAADQGGRLFTTSTGKVLAGSTLSAWFGWSARRLGYPRHFTAHSLRHFHATALLRAGVPIKTVQTRLGHASASMTMEVYAHALPGDDVRAARAIREALSGGPETGLRAVDG